MTKDPCNNDTALWQNIVNTERALLDVIGDFVSKCTNKVSIIRNALNSDKRGTALRVLLYMKTEERQQLFDDLIALASVGHSDIALCREVILSLPRDWLISNIEKSVDRILRDNSTYEEYRRFLELYSKIDVDLAIKLAVQALGNSDIDIKEAGEDCIRWMLGSSIRNRKI